MSVNNVSIAILDSGIAERFSDLIVCSYELIYNENNQYEIKHGTGKDLCGHGSAITNILHSVDPSLNIINFKICNYDNEVSAEALTVALTYIYNNINVNIINISAGVTYIDDYYDLENICQKLSDKGVDIIAAFDNSGAVSYPAAFNSVIGIDCSDEFESDEIVAVDDSILNVIFPKKYYRTFWNSGDKALLCGNSFACAYFSGLYGRHLNNEGISSIHDFIQSIATRTIKCKSTKALSYPDFSINKAIIFPVNKEAHSILRMKSELPFSIVGAFDDRLSGNVGKDYWGTIIQSFEQIDWNADFDTVILSCITDLERIVKKKYSQVIIDSCIKYSKKIYTFEDILPQVDLQWSNKQLSSSSVYFPSISSDMVPYHKMNKLNRISIPVVGIFGTSSKQGKYTVQLDLIKNLKMKQYKVGFLATEPSGYLLSADYTFHFGYHAVTDLSQRGIISILNDCIFDMQKKGAELVVTGCQSATIHYDNSNINRFCIEQYSFLLGTAPDFCVLCINPHDTIEYIQRTISFINSIGDGKVMALALFPKISIYTATTLMYSSKLLNEYELLEYKKYFSEATSLPVYGVQVAEDMDKLCEQIIDFFSDRS